GLAQLAVGRDREERVAFYLEDFAHLHGSPSRCFPPKTIILPRTVACQARNLVWFARRRSKHKVMRFDWSKLGRTPPAALAGARQLAPHVLQWPSRAARANLRSVPDDSHSAFSWEASHAALLTQGLPAKGGEVRTGIRVPRLEMIITRGDNVLDAFQIDGKTDAQAGAWLDSKLRVLGLKQAGDVRLPYELPAHPLGAGPHQLGRLGRELGEIARWFGGAADVLEEFRAKLPGRRASPVVCWPHHFDIATLISLEEGSPANARSIGVGASPGDEYYSQPY